MTLTQGESESPVSVLGPTAGSRFSTSGALAALPSGLEGRLQGVR